MTKPLTPKQEKFANKYVELGNASEAYRQSYDAENMATKTIWEESCRVLGDYKVGERVQEIKDELAEKTMVTLEKLNDRNEYIWSLAKLEDDMLAMQKNVESQAKLNGLIIDKKELTGKDGKDFVNQITVEFVDVEE